MKSFILFLLVLITLMACTRDDICPEDTITTPLLYIDFKDITNRTQSKAVADLLISLNDIDTTLVTGPVNDTLVLVPLNTEANLSQFRFQLNSSSETLNFDLITFNYGTQEEYINRACGFKVNYTNLSVLVEPEPLNENWIIDVEVNLPNIINENEAHITIFH